MRKNEFSTCSRIKGQRLSRLLAGIAGKTVKKFTGVLGIRPLTVDAPEVKAAGFGCHPYFLQGFLQINDDLAAVGKGQRDHAAGALVVNVCIGLIVDPVACELDSAERLLCEAKIFQVGHYNPNMFFLSSILGRRLSACCLRGRPAALLFMTVLAGCGQKGPLFLAPESVPFRLGNSAPSSSSAPLTESDLLAPPAVPAASAPR